MGVTVSLHIEELVLHGFAPADRHAIAAGVQAELVRLLTEQGLPRSMMAGADRGQIDTVPVQVSPGARPQAMGRQIARSIMGGMGE